MNKDCQIKSTDTGFRRCLFSLRGIGTDRLFVLFRHSGFFYSQYAGHGRDLSTEALTSLEVGQFASRLDALLLNVHYRTNRRVTPFCLNFPASQLPSPALPRAGLSQADFHLLRELFFAAGVERRRRSG